MRFLIHIEGPAFETNAVLAETLELLKSYNEGFSSCLHLSAKKHSTRGKPVPSPILTLSTISHGSTFLHTAADWAMGLVPVAPEVVLYGWELYKKASELISMATSFFQRFGRPPAIQIDKSPGALALVTQGNNNVIIAGQDAFEAARSTHRHFDGMAKLINPLQASHISIRPDAPELEAIEIDHTNHTLFAIPDQEVEDADPIVLECSIHLLNTKTGAGRLEFMDEGKPRNVPFVIEAGAIEDYVDAMKASSCIVLARGVLQMNALGEKTLKRFHLIKITNRFDPEEA